jgi:hypothetical protein
VWVAAPSFQLLSLPHLGIRASNFISNYIKNGCRKPETEKSLGSGSRNPVSESWTERQFRGRLDIFMSAIVPFFAIFSRYNTRGKHETPACLHPCCTLIEKLNSLLPSECFREEILTNRWSPPADCSGSPTVCNLACVAAANASGPSRAKVGALL